MVTDDKDEEEGDATTLAIEVEEEVEVDGECSVMHLGSLLLVKGVRPQTMKLRGLVEGVPFLILVDSGATHNFISRRLVAATDWSVKETKPMRIKLGDGYKSVAQGKCIGVDIELENIKVAIDTLLFDLEGIDMVLGISWLASLGEMWLIGESRSNKKWVELKGEGGSNCHQKIETSKLVQQEFKELLGRYTEVFKEPKGLPPKSGKEHGITLLEGHKHVNMTPYC
ncbi:hypothetical protein CR513_14592, partial [Mucuna pruriens]